MGSGFLRYLGFINSVAVFAAFSHEVVQIALARRQIADGDGHVPNGNGYFHDYWTFTGDVYLPEVWDKLWTR